MTAELDPTVVRGVYREEINPETGKLKITERDRHGEETVREVEPRSVQKDLEALGLIG